jgi:hypothetical protein
MGDYGRNHTPGGGGGGGDRPPEGVACVYTWGDSPNVLGGGWWSHGLGGVVVGADVVGVPMSPTLSAVVVVARAGASLKAGPGEFGWVYLCGCDCN